jgi:sugar transferase (PEP-CTERM system associated)
MMKVLALRLTARSLILIVCETALVVAAVAAAAYVRLGDAAWGLLIGDQGWTKALLIAGVAQTCMYYADLYDLRLLSDRRELFTRILQALASASLVLAVVYFWFPALIIGRGVFIVSAIFVIVLVIGWRVAFEWTSRRVRPRERLLLVGTSPAAVMLASELHERRHDLGVEIVGFIDPDPSRVGSPVINPGVIGTVDDIQQIVRSREVDRVVVSLSDARGHLPMDRLLELRLAGVNFDHLASTYEEYTGKIAVENLRPSWLIFNDGFRKTAGLTAAKRILDVAAASAGLFIGWPVMVLVALAIKLTSKGDVLYTQDRVGLNGEVFTVYKFRSMCENAEAETGPVWASKAGDTRVTPIGAWLRRTRLDEMPQLWNVLIGNMSFVGPRPERPAFVDRLTEEIPFYRQRHIVRPGITGWAQVRYTYGATTEDALQKLQYDLYYIKNMSIALDLFIILSTIKTVLLRKGA